ncbi:MAG: DUF305 domain-containing protein [Ilumatobacter sp.]|uniref:DUF305 domain-containing protein n=1 Tax=Ilumatobacter sp. TaxID=1967498 RepID=UPI00391BFF09
MLAARRSIAVFAVVISAAALSACSEIDPFDSTPTSEQLPQRPADVNDADVEFATEMISHVQRGRELAKVAFDSNSDGDVAAIARRIEDQDRKRLLVMSEMLDSWGEPAAESTALETWDELDGLTGVEFDERWTALMIEHHTQAVALAEIVQREGSSRSVNNLASGMLVDLGFEMSTLDSD